MSVAASRSMIVFALGGFAGACGPTSQVDRIGASGPLEEPFAVSRHFAPSGHMGDGKTSGHVSADVNRQCAPRPGPGHGDCYRFTYRPGAELWAGVYWVYPANNWGTRPGRRVEPVFSRVRFFAKSNTDDLGVQFIAGGIRDRELPYSDGFRVSTTETVGSEWQEFSLDIGGQAYDSVIGAFAWVTNYPPATDPATATPIVLYFDDIIWE